MSIADVEIAELRGDMQGRVPTRGSERPKEAAGTRDGQEAEEERSPGRIREQQGHSQGWKGPMSKWPHTKDQSWCGLRLWGVCVRERDAGLEEQFQKSPAPWPI